MNELLIERIIPELREELTGLALREIYQLRETQFAIAFENDKFALVFIAIEPKQPRIYLIKRRLRDLKKEKQNSSKFVIDAKKALAGLQLTDLAKQASERIVEFRFGASDPKFLIAQLTGRSSNLFLLDSERTIVAAARKPLEGEQSPGMTYEAPTRTGWRRLPSDHADFVVEVPEHTLSESLDDYFLRLDQKGNFDSLASEARKKIQKSLAKSRRLIENLEADIVQHGDPEKWKKYGDLLLANQSDAKHEGGSILVVDLFDDAAPMISIEADENDSIPEAARKYFRKYAKARSAAAEIASRMETVRSQLSKSEIERLRIENAIGAEDVEFLNNYVCFKNDAKPKSKQNRASRLPAGVRSFRSSDGFEILVGKKAVDNDFLTFRIANSRDTWMHAADYPGSHVIIRNPEKKEIPQKTLIEAAQLAGFYSQGKKQTKAAVNYTERKFVNKPKGAAPGLVRLASFKTILVEPTFPNVSQA